MQYLCSNICVYFYVFYWVLCCKLSKHANGSLYCIQLYLPYIYLSNSLLLPSKHCYLLLDTTDVVLVVIYQTQ